MAEILAKLRGVLGEVLNDVLVGSPDATRTVREFIEKAQRRYRKVELEPLLTPGWPAGAVEVTSGASPPPRRELMAATIEQVREADLVISQPMIGGRVRPLVAGEPLKIGVLGRDGRRVGRTKCLGRIRIQTGGRQMMYGYRLALPPELHAEDRRQNYRIPLEFDLAVVVELHPGDDAPAIVGVLMDLSAGGAKARIRCPELPAPIRAEGEVTLRMTLPDPVGSFEQPVRINRVERCIRTGHHIIAIEFGESVDAMDRLIRALEIRRAKRRR